MPNRIYKYLLVAIVILGFILRISTIFWGVRLPGIFNYGQQFHPDECKYVQSLLNFPMSIIYTGNMQYPTTSQNLLGIFLMPLKVLSVYKVIGNYYTVCQLALRFASVLYGTAGIYLIYKFTEKFFSSRSKAILAAVFLCFSFYHVLNSPFATTDVTSSFFLLLTFYLSYEIYIRQDKNVFIMSGIAAGLTFGSKFPGVIAFSLPILIYIMLFASSRLELNKDNIQSAIGNVLLFGISGFSMFAVTNLKHILHLDTFFWTVNYQKHFWGDRVYTSRLEMEVWIKQYRGLISALGMPLGVTSVLGMIPIKKDNVDKQLPVVIMIVLYCISWGNLLIARYIIMFMPLLAFLAASFLVDLYEMNKKAVKLLSITAAGLILIYSADYTFTGLYMRLFCETRIEAEKYINSSIPKKSEIGLPIGDGVLYSWYWNLPYVSSDDYIIKNCLDKPKFIILSSANYGRILGAINSDKMRGYVYNPKYAKDWYFYVIPPPEIFLFHDDLLNKGPKAIKYHYKLIKTFSSNTFVPIEFPPPIIKIFERIN